jgi:predicted unusual protein kinase regulating ubiquinone biosynthesis (AarF/ABC1/UbiB family)
MPVYKNSVGAYYTKGLFFEVALEDDKRYVLYTLKNEDYKGYPSIHRLFVEMDDITEYEFAKKYFDSWKQWKMIRSAPWMVDVYNEMKEELDLSIRARALNQIRKTAVESDKDRMQANKFLLERGWQDDDRRGRPSKEKIKDEAAKLVKDHAEIDNDYGRIKLVG